MSRAGTKALLAVCGLAMLVAVGWPLAAQEGERQRDAEVRERKAAEERESVEPQRERPDAERRERAGERERRGGRELSLIHISEPTRPY